ncbi:OB-fold domain-containing protein [Nocardia sp. NPDC052254]|uniref:Zn-ribbon domain-containing OB-fold protein n=1 Tax=Nocardia sp. NPDC052254 TaxID=3155681 RepID=UPI003443659B
MNAKPGIPPMVTEETAPFWEGAAAGRLLVEHCHSCGADSFPPRGICRRCRKREPTFVEITGTGTVYSYTVNYQRWLPNLEVPYAIVLVEFPGHPGIRVAGRLRGCDPEQVMIGMPVEIGFEPGPDDVAVPSFLAADSDGAP